MKKAKIDSKKILKKDGTGIDSKFFERLWEESWTYIKTVVDVVREPVLILDKNLRVLVANEPFYKKFKVKRKETEGKLVYDLGNGQWDIPSLRELLEKILPKDTYFKGFQVVHEFPLIGNKTMLLNARQIHSTNHDGSEKFSPIIMLAIEDITEILAIAGKINEHTKLIEAKFSGHVHKLEISITKLEEEISVLRKIYK